MADFDPPGDEMEPGEVFPPLIAGTPPSDRMTWRDVLQRGVVIPAHPLALTAERKLDVRRQRALSRYYLAAGAGGLAVGVHTTQFAIRRPEVNLYRTVLTICAEEMDRFESQRATVPLVRVAGICGRTPQAVEEAVLARDFGYQVGLVSLKDLGDCDERTLLAHCEAVGEIIPLMGFYLQPAVGGRLLPFSFWRRLAELDALAAVKIAPFNRYQTLDVIRAVAEAGRDDVALYTGNDDNIVLDLVTPFRWVVGDRIVERRIVGGLLGHWAVWTREAVSLLAQCHHAQQQQTVPVELLRRAAEVTDANAAVFDAANGFRGCIAGVHEVLRRQGLLEGTWCLDRDEALGPGQAQEITRVAAAYPHLTDDDFVRMHLDEWLAD